MLFRSARAPKPGSGSPARCKKAMVRGTSLLDPPHRARPGLVRISLSGGDNDRCNQCADRDCSHPRMVFRKSCEATTSFRCPILTSGCEHKWRLGVSLLRQDLHIPPSSKPIAKFPEHHSPWKPGLELNQGRGGAAPMGMNPFCRGPQ